MILRPMTLADAAVVASWGADEEFCRAAGWTVGRAPESLAAFWAARVIDPPEDVHLLAAVAAGVCVGRVDLGGTGGERCELGYVIGPARWGRGLGTAAARAALDLAFGELGIREVWAEAVDANTASVRILQRLGFCETGRGEDAEHLGVATFYRKFAVTREEWAVLSGAAPRV